jgi:intracellular septation protein
MLTQPSTPTNAPTPLVKLVLELGPLVLFFLTNAYAEKWWGVAPDQRIFTATALFMGAVLVATVIHLILYRHIPLMPLISFVVILVFGGLTLWLNDELFIKIKPTLVNSLFGIILLGGLLLKRSLLAPVLGSVFNLTPEGWRILTLRWGLFFLLLAALNEVVWRFFSTDFWVTFKVFGIMPLTVLFALAQIPIMTRYDASTSVDTAPSHDETL